MIPKNGTIVIVDDKIEEALPLITALSRENVSVKYYSGDVDGLPSEPISDIRLLFLDLQLEGSSVNVDADIGRVMSILANLISKNNGPFILLIWSTKEADYREALDEKIKADKSINPLGIKSMEKADFFIRTGESKHPFDVKPDFMDKIMSNLMECLTDFDQMNLLMKFSNIVRESEVNLIRGMSIDTDRIEIWADELSTLMFYMAEAEAGYKSLTTDGKIVNNSVNHAVMNVLSDLLNDKIQRHISDIAEELNDWTIRDSILASIEKDGVNYKLIREGNPTSLGKYNYIYSYGADALPSCGTLKKLITKINEQKDEKIKETGIKLISICVNRLGKVNRNLLTMDYNKVGKVPGTVHVREQVSLKLELTEPFMCTPEEVERISLIALELTPSCDYSQRKWTRHRIQPGLMIPYDIYNSISGNKLSFDYYSTSPILEFENESVILLLDKRYFTSEKLNEFPKDKPIFQFRKEMVIELQSQLGAHVSRPGIRSINP